MALTGRNVAAHLETVEYFRIRPDENEFRQYRIACFRSWAGSWFVLRYWRRAGQLGRFRSTRFSQREAAHAYFRRERARREGRGYTTPVYDLKGRQFLPVASHGLFEQWSFYADAFIDNAHGDRTDRSAVPNTHPQEERVPEQAGLFDIGLAPVFSGVLPAEPSRNRRAEKQLQSDFGHLYFDIIYHIANGCMKPDNIIELSTVVPKRYHFILDYSVRDYFRKDGHLNKTTRELHAQGVDRIGQLVQMLEEEVKALGVTEKQLVRIRAQLNDFALTFGMRAPGWEAKPIQATGCVR